MLQRNTLEKMSDTVSFAKFTDPRNRAQAQQALDLVRRGKAGIAGQDPALRPFVNTILQADASARIALERELQQPTQAELDAGQSLIDRGQAPPPTQAEIEAGQSLVNRDQAPQQPPSQPSFQAFPFTPSEPLQETRQDLAPQTSAAFFLPQRTSTDVPVQFRGTPENVPKEFRAFTGTRFDVKERFQDTPSKLGGFEGIFQTRGRDRIIADEVRGEQGRLEQQALDQITFEAQSSPELFGQQKGVIGMSTDTGTSFTLTPEFIQERFAGINEAALVKAEASFAERPLFERKVRGVISSTVGGIKGAAFIGEGVINFPIEVGAQFVGGGIIKKDEKFSPFKLVDAPRIDLGKIKFIGETRASPSVAPPLTDILIDPVKFGKRLPKQTQAQVALASATGVVFLPQFTKKGLKFLAAPSKTKAIFQTLPKLSPIQIKSGTFTAPIASNEKIIGRVKPVKFGDDTGDIFVGFGKDKPLKIEALKFDTGAGKGVAKIRVSEPATIIDNGVISEALQISEFQSVITSKQALGTVAEKKFIGGGELKKVFEGFSGGKVGAITTPTRSVLLRQPTREIFFKAGKEVPFFKFEGVFVKNIVPKLKLTTAGVFASPISKKGAQLFGAGQEVKALSLEPPINKVRFRSSITGVRVQPVKVGKVTDLTEEEIAKILKPRKKTPLETTFAVQDVASVTGGVSGALGRVTKIKTVVPKGKIPKISPRVSTETSVDLKPVTSTIQIPKVVTRTDVSQPQPTAVRQFSNLSSITAQLPQTRTRTELASIVKPETIQKIRQSSKTKQSTRQRQRQQTRQRTVQEQVVITPPVIVPIPTPTKIQIRTPIGFGLPRGGTRQVREGGAFTVFLRRFGKFKPIGTARTQRGALDIGRTAAGRTLGATFKIEGADLKLPKRIKGFRRKGRLFIERRRFRLSTGTELKEIQRFKRLKGGVL